jgi:NADH-quinone oxidoreductase subunit F
MISSLEGKRGIPTFRPPYPATHGLWGNPSVVNNVETLANIPAIVEKGSSWYKTMGTAQSPGTKVYPVSGKVKSPGVYELPMNVTLKELLFEHCNGMKDDNQFKAALIGGGAAGAFLGEECLDVKLSFEDLQNHNGLLGTGAVLVLDEDTSIIQVLASIVEFFAHESCGLCTPCRVGTARILDMLHEIKNKKDDYSRILNIARIMHATCACPLGKSVIVPLSTGLALGD